MIIPVNPLEWIKFKKQILIKKYIISINNTLTRNNNNMIISRDNILYWL